MGRNSYLLPSFLYGYNQFSLSSCLSRQLRLEREGWCLRGGAVPAWSPSPRSAAWPAPCWDSSQLHQSNIHCTLIRFVSTSDKCGISTVVGIDGTLECAHFSFNKCPIKTNDDANAYLAQIETKWITVHIFFLSRSDKKLCFTETVRIVFKGRRVMQKNKY
jgi:hypothetical protein